MSKYDTDDGFRWYHALFVWMILLPLFSLAVFPPLFFKGWPIIIVVGIALLGVFLVLKVPPGKKKTNNDLEG
jgi:RsiW-degrading membrane proteinase PrsW (M82 family)